MRKTRLGVLFLTGCMVMALCACGNQDSGKETSGPVQMEAEDVTDISREEAQGEEASNWGKITLELKDVSETAQVYAVITCEKDGAQIWQHTTPTYYVGQVDTIEEIGVCNGMYYFAEQGTVTALDVQTGEVRWQNQELEGSGVAYDFDEHGTLYIAGYFSPDLMMIDKDGKTLKKLARLDEEKHYWPYQVDYEDGYVYITYECYDDWNWDEKAYPEGHGLSYRVSDGSIGVEHNVTEAAPQLAGSYENTNFDTLQVDYLGEDTYLINMSLYRTQYISNLKGQREGDTVVFEGDYENGFSYKGQIEKAGDQIVLTITETTDPTISVGQKYYF
ncbi:MAG: hypothetical protein IJ335_07470 [Lachnospiraceae bacterium]|nr:hypothetical protein [Lachnospiraceae bacterium]